MEILIGYIGTMLGTWAIAFNRKHKYSIKVNKYVKIFLLITAKKNEEIPIFIIVIHAFMQLATVVICLLVVDTEISYRDVLILYGVFMQGVCVLTTCLCSWIFREESEIQQIRKYFKKNTEYTLVELSDAVSVDSFELKEKKLKYTRYILKSNKQNAKDDYFCVYIFPSYEEAKRCYLRLDKRKQKLFYRISQSLVYVPVKNEEVENMLRKAESRFKR